MVNLPKQYVTLLIIAVTVGMLYASTRLFAPTEQAPVPVQEYTPPAEVAQDYTPPVTVTPPVETETAKVEDGAPFAFVRRTIKRYYYNGSKAKSTASVVKKKQKPTKRYYTNMQYARLAHIRKQNQIRDNDYRTIFSEGVNADFGRY